MAKKTYSHNPNFAVTKDKRGRQWVVLESADVVEQPKVTRAQRKSLREMPWTPGPRTKGQKIARTLWG